MSDRTSFPDDAPTQVAPPLDEPLGYADEEPWAEPEALPRRPRRKLVTPWTLGLAAVIVGAGGFVAGAQVQKGEQGSGGGGGAAAGMRALGGAAGMGAAGGQRGGSASAATGGDGTTAAAGTPTAGEVTSKDGATLYVQDSSGTTVKVKTNGNSTVTRTAKSTVSGIHPGDTVVITGTTNGSGTVTATQITATASGVSALGGLGGGMPGGAGGFPGGGMPGGGAPGAAAGGAGSGSAGG